MWNKDKETEEPKERQRNIPAGEAPRPSRAARESATIGPSITIEGGVSGDEDLLIQGRVDGKVDLKEHSVTVGREGRVKADITGRVVTIEGEVDGNLKADEQVVLRSSARVEGDITAPRVVLEDGARFQGLVDMGEPAETGGGRTDGRSGASARPTPERPRTSSPSSSPTGASPGKSADSDKSAEDKEADEAGKTESVKAT